MTDRPPSWWRLRVRDDAGVYHRLDLRQWKRSTAARDPIEKESMRHARRAFLWPWPVSVLMGFCLTVLIARIIGRVGFRFWSWDAFLIASGVVIISAPVGLIMGAVQARVRARGAIPFMKTIRACTACAYSLDGVMMPDGWATCPECGVILRRSDGATA